MPHPHQRSSSTGAFIAIYVVITLLVGLAIFFLSREKKASLGKPKERVISSEPPTKIVEAKPPPEKPKSDKPKAKPKEKPEPAKPPPEPPPEKKTEPEKIALTPEEEKEIEQLYPLPDLQPLMEIVNNWQDVPKNAYPKLVAIRKPITFEVKDGGQTVAQGTLPVGSMMAPLELMGSQLTLSGGGASPITATVPVDDTDFKDLIQSRYDTFVEKRNAQVISQRNAERQRRLSAIAMEKALNDWNDGSDPRFDPLKASLQKGDASIYSLTDATKWRWGGTEEIDGTEYETAFVLIVSEAAFGVSERELKALMREGKVVSWLDPATGEKI